MTKQKKKFVVIGMSDAKYGDFLINHWLRSLKENIDENLVDIAVLDYGMTEKQVKKLLEKSVKLEKSNKDGHVVNIRYRDMLKFLEKNPYEQIMTCDSGDLIFQDDITHLFHKHKDKYRGVCEGLAPPAIEYTLVQKPFPKEIEEEIEKTLINKKMVNGGLVIAPYEKFIELCKTMNKLIKNKHIFGPDQVVLNYTLYKEGFKNLDKKYNYTITTHGKFKIKKGIFYDHKKNIIPIVHNSGNFSFFRPIKNFGYGENYNKLKLFPYLSLRAAYSLNFIVNPVLRFFRKKNLTLKKSFTQ